MAVKKTVCKSAILDPTAKGRQVQNHTPAYLSQKEQATINHLSCTSVKWDSQAHHTQALQKKVGSWLRRDAYHQPSGKEFYMVGTDANSYFWIEIRHQAEKFKRGGGGEVSIYMSHKLIIFLSQALLIHFESQVIVNVTTNRPAHTCNLITQDIILYCCKNNLEQMHIYNHDDIVSKTAFKQNATWKHDFVNYCIMAVLKFCQK